MLLIMDIAFIKDDGQPPEVLLIDNINFKNKK